jgi:molybdenum cofactor cytidylyltransferase
LNGRTLIDNILDALAEAGIDEQVVVLGYKPTELLETLGQRIEKVKVAINMDFELGMSSSFQKGLQHLKNVDAAFLVLGDEPIFDPKILLSLIEQMEQRRGKALIATPIFNGKKGHPLLFHSQLFAEILDLKSSQTIRDVVHSHADKLVKIDAPQWTTMDIDTPEDYDRVCNLIKTRQNP